MIGSFVCSPNLCPKCSRAAVAIQMQPLSDWSHLIEGISDETHRACVREYLAGIYRRGKASAQASKEGARG